MSYKSKLEDKKRKALKQQKVFENQARMAKQTGDRKLSKFAREKIAELSKDINNFETVLNQIDDVEILKADRDINCRK